MDFVLKVKRAETPFYAFLKRTAKGILTFEMPGASVLVPLLKTIAFTRSRLAETRLRLAVVFYRAPLFRSACVSVGKNLYMELLPSISSHTRVTVGNNVFISGAFNVVSGHVYDAPELIVGNGVFIGHRVAISVSRQVIVEDEALIAQGCYIADNDGHPRDSQLRVAGGAVEREEIRPVRIGRRAWLGLGCYVLKGVTIGEGAIIGAGSVVVSDIPPFTVAMGNPARVIRRIET